MLIVVDKGLPDAETAFESFGEVVALPGREMTPQHVREADALIVRSVTQVGPALLAGSSVRFVGTATTGTDHVDIPWLQANGIRFASAAGCNARPVAEYVFAAILDAACRLDFDPLEKTLGIVGVGRIGGIVADWAEQIGMRVLRCDPPLAEQGGGAFVLPETIAAEADIITIHVPLTREGPHATQGMIDAAWFGRLRKRPVYINASRGDVVDESAFQNAVGSGAIRFAAVDVWRNEPDIDSRSLAAADIATPHIAGYSQEAKDRAVAMIVAAAREYLCEDGEGGQAWLPGPVEVEPGRSDNSATSAIALASACPWWRCAASACRAALDLATIDARLRAAAAGDDTGGSFDDIRLSLARRREFTYCSPGEVALPEPGRRFLSVAGFNASWLM